MTVTHAGGSMRGIGSHETDRTLISPRAGLQQLED